MNPVAAKTAAMIGYVIDLHCREGAARDTIGMSAICLISVRPMPLPLSPLDHF